MDPDTPVAGVVVEGARPQWTNYGGYHEWASNVYQPGDYPEPITYFESETQNFVLEWAQDQMSWDDNVDPTNPYAIAVFAVILNKEADIYHTARYWAPG